MASYIERSIDETHELSVEERNLLSVAFKNVIGVKRSSWRIIALEEEKLREKSDEIRERSIKEYKQEIEKEIKEFCTKVIALLDDKLLSSTSLHNDSKIFYWKMKGDYLRYKAEVSIGTERKELAEQCYTVYKTAMGESSKDGSKKEREFALEPTDPIHLGTALNYSVFIYEILNDPQRACQVAKTAFDDAMEKLDSLNEDVYKDSTLIMQLLRDNMTLWTSELNIEGNTQEQETSD